MTLDERSDLVLAFARVLFINGQATEQIVAAAQRLGHSLGMRAKLMLRWGELQLQSEDNDTKLISRVAAEPVGVNMDRVASTMRTIVELDAGRLAPAAAMQAIGSISQAPPAPIWLFTCATGAGAVALSMIFGIEHCLPALLIFVSAAAGAIVRRVVAHYSANIFIQPFCAALLAGIIGALAVRLELSSSLSLVVVCPCMVLVPGPHILNGAIDLINGRIHLGAARLVYAGLVVVAIATGLLLGLGFLGISLPVDPAVSVAPLWQDMVAAGVAVFAFSIFFCTPLNLLVWPVAVGMLAHALRWFALTMFGATPAIGAFVACVVVGAILTPVARRWQMPLAGIAFASVVSMMPGMYLFRMASGLAQIAQGSHVTLPLISATIANGMIAMTTTLAMSVGLIVPKLVIDYLGERSMCWGKTIGTRRGSSQIQTREIPASFSPYSATTSATTNKEVIP
jgi:uncharacterized membrane protein YjjP (DUF1212 family)